MGLHSGKWAVINGVGTVRSWSINETQAPARGLASNTKFAPIRKKGVFSWNGSYNAYGAIPACMPGVLFGFTGYGAPNDDVSGAGQLYTGNAMVSGVTLTWNWGNGEFLGHTVNFAGDLALTKSSGSQPTDVSTPSMPGMELCKIQTGTPPDAGYADLPNVVTATLNISCSLQAAVNSSTIVGSGSLAKIWTAQKAGPVDWSLSISQQDNERVGTIPFDIGDNRALKLFVNDSQFWHLKWGHCRGFEGLTADRESGALLARTINFDMTAIDPGAPSTLGTVTDPSGSIWWPPA